LFKKVGTSGLDLLRGFFWEAVDDRADGKIEGLEKSAVPGSGWWEWV
jgi:hypothetical protein